jgi:HK97 gp10 family phage protein
MDFAVKVEGLKGVEDALHAAGPKLAATALRKALKAGSDVFLREAKSRAPVLSTPTPARTPGELRDAIQDVTKLKRRQEAGVARVGLRHDKEKGTQSPGVYGLFVEYGTYKTKAQPYMRPAYDTANREAEAVFTAEIRRGVANLKK